MSILNLSQDLLLTVKLQKDISKWKEALKTTLLEQLITQLNTDQKKVIFWVNIYNAFFQILIDSNPNLFDNKSELFSKKSIHIAGQELSLDDIEHGILRKSKIKYGLGYLSNPFASKIERALRVHAIDPRIHFALNCGAESCPAIRFYSLDCYEDEFNMAAKSFLDETTQYDDQKNTVIVSAILSWFRGDFNGIIGIKKMLKRYGYIPHLNVTLKFQTYNWTKKFKNFA